MPIAAELLPHLEQAIASSPSDLVFPHAERRALAIGYRLEQPIAAVQQIMRHSDPSITMRVYAHPEDEWLDEFADRLSFGFTAQKTKNTAPALHSPKTPSEPSEEGLEFFNAGTG